jgi:hypothetical protein
MTRVAQPRFWLLVTAAVAALGCGSIPLEATPSGSCSARGRAGRGASAPCQRHLVIGFFPSVGEAHLNGLATNGKPLTGGLRAADYSLRPLFIAGVNVLSLGFPTVAAWLLEPYEDYDPAPGRCALALLGYCKAAKLVSDGPAALDAPESQAR